MNSYESTPCHDEVRDYVRKNLATNSQIKRQECRTLLSRLHNDRTLYFSLFTALELMEIELPRTNGLPSKTFYITVRNEQNRSTFDDVEERIWNHDFHYTTFPDGVSCITPIDTWIQFAQYLEVVELTVLAESIARRWGYTKQQFHSRLSSFKRIRGRKRCKAALELMDSSDSVQETRTRLALLSSGLPSPHTRYVIESPGDVQKYTVDMAYPRCKVAIEYDGDHHRLFRQQHIRDQRKRQNLRNMGWKVIVAFSDDLQNHRQQLAFAEKVAENMGIELSNYPMSRYQSLTDRRLNVGARKGEYHRYLIRKIGGLHTL